MSQSLVTTLSVDKGTVSRYVKPSCIEDGKILNEAFDLRDRKPPEKYVSFYLLSTDNQREQFSQAFSLLRMASKPNGGITLLDVEEVLEEINDEEDDIIAFFQKELPHCGLVYLSNNITKIQEAKTTLSYLATNRFEYIKNIQSYERLN